LSWLQDAGFPPHVTDALGHAIEGVLKIYARGEQRDLKTRALQAWADYLSGKAPAGAQVVDLSEARQAR
jgi:hypothetical protein